MGTPSIMERLHHAITPRAFRTQLRHQLAIALLGITFIPLIVMGYLYQRSASQALLNQSLAKLSVVRATKAEQLVDYFAALQAQTASFAQLPTVAAAMRDLPAALLEAKDVNGIDQEALDDYAVDLKTYYTGEFSREYRRRNGADEAPVAQQYQGLSPEAIYLQWLYIRDNSHPLGSKQLLNHAGDRSNYSQLHQQYHPLFRELAGQFGCEDILLCDLSQGNIVYSVAKNLEYATSLKTGPYAQTNLGRAFRLAAAAPAPRDVFLVDFEPFAPSYEDAACFISSPIYSGKEKIGVAIFHVSVARLHQLLQPHDGMGRTGETYAMGADRLFRNDSRFLDQLQVATTILNPQVVPTRDPALLALDGGSGRGVIGNYRAEVAAAWGPVTIHASTSPGSEPVRWGLVSAIDLAEVYQPLSVVRLASSSSIALLITAALGISVAWIFTARFTKQVDSLHTSIKRVAEGDFNARCNVRGQDELGQLGTALNLMLDEISPLIQSREERERIESSIRALQNHLAEVAEGNLVAQVALPDDLTRPLAVSLNQTTLALRGRIAEIFGSSGQVRIATDKIHETTQDLLKGTETQSIRVLDASEAIGQMTASIIQVAENSETSATVAEEAKQNASKGARAVANTIEGMDRIRNQVQETSKRIKRLGESSQEIGEIVQLISDIADRTSILALNASIQAAMAGDAGQGFAVVAEEVERLAERSNDATKQIAALIKAIQTETAEAIAGMEESTREVVEGSMLASEAGQTLADIDSVSNRLAELITTISDTTKQQVLGAEAIAMSMSEISEVTELTRDGSKLADDSARSLSTTARRLRSTVERFSLPPASVDNGSTPASSTDTAPLDTVTTPAAGRRAAPPEAAAALPGIHPSYSPVSSGEASAV